VNREYKPMSRLLRSAFVVCALMMTTCVFGFVGLLASDAGAVVALPAAVPAASIAGQG